MGLHKYYQDLMHLRVKNILIIASAYDAFIMEQDGGMLEHVFMQVRGISLVEPPRFKVVSSGEKAFRIMEEKKFDLILFMPRYLERKKAINFGRKVKSIQPDTPLVLLCRSAKELSHKARSFPSDAIDRVFVWSGNRNILWAIVKWREDSINALRDTALAMVRCLIVVEDSPYYYSSILPLIYRQIVKQTQAVMDDTLSDEQRLLKLRARTKILLASNYEEAEELYRRFNPYLIGVIADTRFEKNGEILADAGLQLLETIKRETPGLPLLLTSNEHINAEKAEELGVPFQDKNSPHFHQGIKQFILTRMGFGAFVFKGPHGEEIARARNIRSLEKALKHISDESLRYHCERNHFSNWFYARAEVELAMSFRSVMPEDFSSTDEIRRFLLKALKDHRRKRLRGVISQFDSDEFDFRTSFFKIGEGSLGGKARGLAFMSRYLQENIHFFKEFSDVSLSLPKTAVVGTDFFDAFIEKNGLHDLTEHKYSNEDIAKRCLASKLPGKLYTKLKSLLQVADYPLAVRSSSLLEDSQEQPYAGLYSTYMLANNAEDFDERLAELCNAVKLVYASTFYVAPKAFSRTTLHRTEEEKMAVIIQQVIGSEYGDHFYPLISGTAQSHNFYPLSYMDAEDGVAQMSMGLGKIVVEGGQTLRFCPKYPKKIVSFGSVDMTLSSAQTKFYCLKMKSNNGHVLMDEDSTLEKRDVFDARKEVPFYLIASSFYPDENRIRDSYSEKGAPVLTFANILKYNAVPMPAIITKMLDIAKKGFGCDVDIEFALNVNPNGNMPGEKKYEFVLLQARPMITAEEDLEVKVGEKDINDAVCYSTNALGSGINDEIQDIVFVHPDKFNAQTSFDIANEVSILNAELEKEGKKYLLVGPGRWGSSDHCLGVPVQWNDISNVAAIVEATTDKFRPDPSQGTHFFQNITSLGISYFTVHDRDDFLKWDWFSEQNASRKLESVSHFRLSKGMTIKIDGKKNSGVILE